MPQDERRFHPEHLWCGQASDGQVPVGISAFAQTSLGEIVYFDLPEVGARVEAGVPMGTVESIKVVNDLVAPVTGEVVEVNAALADDPSLANTDPYGAGWLVRVVPDDPAALEGLLDEAAYLELVGA
jgi:glycine cleavage system H protein